MEIPTKLCGRFCFDPGSTCHSLLVLSLAGSPVRRNSPGALTCCSESECSAHYLKWLGGQKAGRGIWVAVEQRSERPQGEEERADLGGGSGLANDGFSSCQKYLPGSTDVLTTVHSTAKLFKGSFSLLKCPLLWLSLLWLTIYCIIKFAHMVFKTLLLVH